MLAWTVGATLLVSYAGARAWYAYSRDQGIAQFQALRNESHETSPPAVFDPAENADAVDTSTWSRDRIARYQASLHSDAIPQAVLRIPALKLAVPVFEGASDENLNRGAGRIEGTASIGEAGNIGIAAHRDGFFRVLKDVQLGDILLLERLDATDAYRIVETLIVEPSEVGVLSATPTPTVTLVTCYPFYYVGSAPLRFIVRAEKTPAGNKPAGDDSRVAFGGGTN
jgi:sortase A